VLLPRARWAAVLAAVVVSTVAVPVVPAAPAAAAASEATVVCRFSDARLQEVSAMAWSLRHPGTLWLLNDSGGGPYLYAVDATTCVTKARVRLAGATARDYESMATGVDAQGRDTIWVGDTGDNLDSWPDVRIIAVPEPATLTDGARLRTTEYRFTYPDRPHNAEALLADPRGPRLWVATKALLDGALWRIPPLRTGVTLQARRLAGVPGLITDGAIAPDGSRTVIRDYVWAWVYDGMPSKASLRAAPQRISLPNQPLGEAVAWSADGTALLLASESDNRLLRLPLPREAWTATAQAAADASSPPAPTTSGAAAADDRAAPGEVGSGALRVAAAVLLCLGALGAVLVGRRLRA
jgi:hypothetical protein